MPDFSRDASTCDDYGEVLAPTQGADGLMTFYAPSAWATETVFEVNHVDRNGKETCEPKGRWMELTVDSGAGDSVANPQSMPANVVLTPSTKNVSYLGPAGEKIPHLGEMKLTTILSSGRSARFTFQGAPVRKPLLAVSGIVGKGHSVLFSPTGCWIIPPSGRAAADISNLASRHPEALPMTQKNGVYVLKVQVPDPAAATASETAGGSSASGFIRRA